jgi:hypothetical protein
LLCPRSWDAKKVFSGHGGRDESPGDHEGDLGVGAGIDDVEVARGVGAHVSDFRADAIHRPLR